MTFFFIWSRALLNVIGRMHPKAKIFFLKSIYCVINYHTLSIFLYIHTSDCILCPVFVKSCFASEVKTKCLLHVLSFERFPKFPPQVLTVLFVTNSIKLRYTDRFHSEMDEIAYVLFVAGGTTRPRCDLSISTCEPFTLENKMQLKKRDIL